MVVPVDTFMYIALGLAVGTPLLVLSAILYFVMQERKRTKILLRISEKEFKIINCTAEGKRLKAEWAGLKRSWNISTDPYILDSFWGKTPLYYAHLGNANTQNFDNIAVKALTEEQLSLIESQSALTALLKVDIFSIDNIMMIIGMIGIGVVIGVIIGKLIFTGAPAP
jgi:hypothetical protein